MGIKQSIIFVVSLLGLISLGTKKYRKKYTMILKTLSERIEIKVLILKNYVPELIWNNS